MKLFFAKTGKLLTANFLKFLTANFLTYMVWLYNMYLPIGHLLISAGLLSTIDIGLGLIRAKKQNIPITSTRFISKFKVFGLFWGLISCAIIAGPAFQEFGYPFYSAATYASSLFIFYEFLGIINKMADLNLSVAKYVMEWLGKKTGIQIKKVIDDDSA